MTSKIEMPPKITFERPPLIEVSFAVQFERLMSFRTGHFGLFWAQIHRDFPETADRPPLSPINAGQSAGEWLPLPRVWFVHKDKQLLLQLQDDRFILNWRRIMDDAVYPRFDTVFPLFLDHLKRWEAYCEFAKIGPLNIRNCELTYVNHIPKGEGWVEQKELAALFPGLMASDAPKGMPARTGFAYSSVHEFPTLQLRADIRHGFIGEERKEIMGLELKAESAGHLRQGADALKQWFADANEAIVTSFVAMTNPTTQKEVWKLVSR